MVAVDLKTAPKLSTDGNTYTFEGYTFEGAVSGYYSDPVPASQWNSEQSASKVPVDARHDAILLRGREPPSGACFG